LVLQHRDSTVFSIDVDGQIVWKGREVETDADLRESVRDVVKVLLEMAAPEHNDTCEDCAKACEQEAWEMEISDEDEISRDVVRGLKNAASICRKRKHKGK